MVHDTDEEQHTFDVEAEQYTVILKSNVSCPIHCMIIDSPRWGEKKPKPDIGTFITVGGLLDTVVRSDSGEVVRYDVSVDFVNFLGRSTYPVRKRSELPTKHGIVSKNANPLCPEIEQGAPAAKKARFQYDLVGKESGSNLKGAAEEEPTDQGDGVTKKSSKGKGRA